MNLLKKILIGLAVLIILLLVLAFILPKELNVKVTEEIDAPANVVYNVINDLGTQELWNPWKANDATMAFQLGDKTIGKGATYSWTSENSGSGSQTITNNVINEMVETQVEFDGMGMGKANYSLVPNGDKTNVTWDFSSESSIPMNLFNILAKMQLKSTFAEGLKNIGNVAVKRFKNNEYGSYIVKDETVDGRIYLVKRGEVPADNIMGYYTQSLPTLFKTIQEANLAMQGKPSILFFSYSPNADRYDMAAALPIEESVALADSDASIVTMPAGRALVVDYLGDYTQTGKAHIAISSYMSDHGMLKKYPIIQEFVTDTSEETDQSKWLTKIIYFVAE